MSALDGHPTKVATPPARADRWTQATIALYVVLWIFEGAFRKWVPGTSMSFYVLRDVLFGAMVLGIALSSTNRYGSARWFWPFIVPISLVTITQVFLALVSPDIALLGLRSYLAPALFVAVLAVWGGPQTIKLVRKIVFLAIPLQLALCTVQVFSPARSWVNAQVGSDEASFVNFGFVRPAGTFSAPAGLATFIPIALAFALFEFSARYKRKGLAASFLTAATLTIVAVSGSRGLVLTTCVVFVFYVLSAVLSWRRSGGLPLTPLVGLFAVIGTVGAVLLSSVINSFVLRFSSASQAEDPLARLLAQAFGFLTDPVTVLGSGAGSRSQVGIAAGSALTWLEVDNQRWVAELGFLGFVLAACRVVAFVLLCVAILREVKQTNWLYVLVGAGFLPTLFSGSLTQTPSAQAGAAVAIALLILAKRTEVPPGATLRTSQSRPLPRRRFH